MASWIKGVELERQLRASPIVRELQEQSTVDVAAMLVALADVESSYQIDATGDGGSSYGLWQVNSKVWPFNAARLGDVGYQIEAMAPVFDQANEAVQWALDNLRARGLAGELACHQTPAAGLAVTKCITRPTAAIEQPLWYSIIWQYGIGRLTGEPPTFAFKNWIASTFDTGEKGFADYRASVGKPVKATYYKRQKRARDTYGVYADPITGITGQDADQAGRADFYEDVIADTGRDLASLPKRALPWVPVGLFALGLGIAAWSTARRAI